MSVEITVVVCTLDREARLRRALRGLARVRGPAFETVVVNGPSRDGSAGVARAAGARLVEIERRNLAAARNAGVAVARGRLLAFLDDDAVPSRSWLAEIARAFEEPGVAAAGGPVLDRRGPALSRPLGVSPYGFPRTWDGSPRLSRYATGGNMAFPRAVLLAIGGFDENLPFHLEDADACVRLRAHGRVAFRPGAIVFHDPGDAAGHRRPEQVIRSASYFAFRHARGAARLGLPLAPLLHALSRLRRAPAGARWVEHAARCLHGAALGYAAAWPAPRLPLAP